MLSRRYKFDLTLVIPFLVGFAFGRVDALLVQLNSRNFVNGWVRISGGLTFSFLIRTPVLYNLL